MVGTSAEPGGKSLYIVVENPDGLYTKAKAAGVKIEQDPTDRDYGSREFICRDLEGNIWCFGTYWPKARESAE